MERPVGVGCAATWWQRRSGVSTDQTWAAEARSGDVERHLAVGKETGACEGGGALSVRSGRAYLHTVSALVAYSWIGVGLYSSQELPRA